VKKSLLWIAIALFLSTLSTTPIARADAPPPTCNPTGCQKPGVVLR
jgi:hypothetical protein